MATKPVLGRGLGSLFPTANTAQSGQPGLTQPPTAPNQSGQLPPSLANSQAASLIVESSKDRHPGISLANLDEIVANPYQPRRDFDEAMLEELAQSIRENGIIQPLVVRRVPRGYELIAGERRFRAARKAGLTQVPIVVRKTTDRESLELALIENIQRQNLNCVDEALAYFQLMQDFSLTQEEVSTKVGKERATVANHLRLLRLPQPILEDLKKETITFGHGKVLLSVEDPEKRVALYRQMLDEKLSVRESERRAENLKGGAMAGATTKDPSSGKVSAIKNRFAQLSTDLSHQWSTRVELKGGERKGKVVIHYSSRQDLERILTAMQNEKQWQAN